MKQVKQINSPFLGMDWGVKNWSIIDALSRFWGRNGSKVKLKFNFTLYVVLSFSTDFDNKKPVHISRNNTFLKRWSTHFNDKL